jgi:mediator of replication checkpoint protein 1
MFPCINVLKFKPIRFLTQTRPENGSPEIYRPSPSQSLYSGDSFRAPLISPLQPRPRAPLRTLSISSPFRQPDSPEQVPLRRLRKAVTPPIGLRSIAPPATTPPRKRNAFEMLARGATKAEKRTHDQLKGVDLSAFLENEAAESDDENTFGFAKPKDDDEEDGEDLDKTLDVLMDDKEMDEATVAAELVHEKFM